MPKQPSNADPALDVMTSAVDATLNHAGTRSKAIRAAYEALAHAFIENRDFPEWFGLSRSDARLEQLSFLSLASTYPVLLGTLGDDTGANSRKKQGAYYTPLALVDHLVEKAVVPALDDHPDPIRTYHVCDPAVGAGVFLLQSARTIAHHLRETGKRGTLDDVITRCVFGIDIDPVAATLCRALLAMETSNPRETFDQLAAHIKVGSAILGATPELIERGIPSSAFIVKDGDDNDTVRAAKKRNTAERRSSRAHHPHTEDPEPWLSADAWCAAFFWPMHAEAVEPMTQGLFDIIRTRPETIDPAIRAQIETLAREHDFFHWHLEFPEVTGWAQRTGTPPSGTIV